MHKTAKMILLTVISLVVGFWGFESHGELYLGIRPFDTLGDLRKKFPNAKFEKLNPAWAQEKDVMFKITGSGISGAILIFFNDSRPSWRETIRNESNEILKKEIYQKILDELGDDDIWVNGVRWVPDSPFPVQRMITKYGEPDKSGVSDENFRPFKAWTEKGVSANLSDAADTVLSIDFHFSGKDWEDAFKKRGMDKKIR